MIQSSKDKDGGRRVLTWSNVIGIIFSFDSSQFSSAYIKTVATDGTGQWHMWLSAHFPMRQDQSLEPPLYLQGSVEAGL